MRRVWARKGHRPTALGQRRYVWRYLYGYVHPASGRLIPYVLPTVNTEAFEATLVDFARLAGVGPDLQVVLVLDGAGWHRSKKLKVPEGIHFAFLPPYSPELQPVERVWPLVNEAFANRALTSLKELDDTVDRRCIELANDSDKVWRHTLYKWWPEQE